MAAFKYFRATHEPGNLYAGAALPDGTGQGLEDGTAYQVHNRSLGVKVYVEERPVAGPVGAGDILDKGESGNYNADADTPLFVWTDQPSQTALLVISEAE